jgi:hypothetical protein
MMARYPLKLYAFERTAMATHRRASHGQHPLCPPKVDDLTVAGTRARFNTQLRPTGNSPAARRS